MSGGAHARRPASDGPRIDVDALRGHCAAILCAADLPGAAAELVADSLVDAEGRGIASHGVARTRIYAERLRAGLLDATATPVIVHESAAAVHIDARHAIGHLGADLAVSVAAERALQHSVCAVGVANSGHCGTLAYFARRAAERGLVVLAMSTAPPTMVYFGGSTRAVGTNPFCIAVPRDAGPPLVLDMATSATARGRIILAERAGEPIPPGWAVDTEGRPTTDAAAALRGSVTPFAGPKGSGLAMMIDLLAGAMVSGVSGEDIGDMYEDWTRPQQVGHLVIAIDPEAWLGRAAFAAYVAGFVERVHGLPPAEGFDRIQVPGEAEDEAWRQALAHGVPVPAHVAADLDLLAAEFDVPHRLEADAAGTT